MKKTGKFTKRGVTAKAFAVILAVVALVSVAVGGTLAWLTDTSDEVVNTFTPSDIAITLTEEEGVVDGVWKQQMIPGAEYPKDPTVAVVDDTTNIDVYLFVKFEANEAATTYLTYTSTLTEANGWKLVDGETNVWYRVVEDDAAVQSWELLEGNKVAVKDTVTKENMAEAATASLSYTAYAIQVTGFESDVAGAWAQAQGLEANA